MASGPERLVVPPADAQFTDKLQWLAINKPYAIGPLHHMVEHVISKYRTAHPRPRSQQQSSLILSLSSKLEFTGVTVNDPSALIAPAEGRINRRMEDIVPTDLMDTFDRCLYRVRKSGSPKTYTYQYNGVRYRGTVATPGADSVMLAVAKALTVALALVPIGI